MSKTVRGWIKTVGGDGRETREGGWKKGREGKGMSRRCEMENKPTDGRNDYLIFDLIILN